MTGGSRFDAGSWRGGTVAVKVLCHEGSRTAKLNALHESVVCAHVQHPNVVRWQGLDPFASTTSHELRMKSSQQLMLLCVCFSGIGH